MSNLASRSHEWESWQIEEILLELPRSQQSKAKRRKHFRVVLRVKWCDGGEQLSFLTLRSSPTLVLLHRKRTKKTLATARILARKLKDSTGRYQELASENIEKYLNEGS